MGRMLSNDVKMILTLWWLVWPVGFEPTTPATQTRCASKLRYGQWHEPTRWDRIAPRSVPLGSGSMPADPRSTTPATELGGQARLVALTVADDPAAWEGAGFTVVDGTVAIGGTTIHLTGRTDDRALRGIRDWTVSGLDAPTGNASTGSASIDSGRIGSGSIDGIVTTFTPSPEEEEEETTGEGQGEGRQAAGHPNGATGIDHVVIITPDLDRTIAAFAAVGLGVRRIRETESYGAPMRQAFLRLGSTIVEVVGGHEGTGGSAEEAPASWFGLALDVADLDATAALLGDGLGGIKPAVQEGRRIATIRHKNFGMSVATALMDDGTMDDGATDDGVRTGERDGNTDHADQEAG